MIYDVVVVGGGIAGLTCGAFLSQKGYRVLICEQGNKIGGLVNTFKYKDFKFDGGIRAIENSGIVFPMLKALSLEMPFSKNVVSLMVGNEIIKIDSPAKLREYEIFLSNLFPANKKDIHQIINEIKKIMKYMKVLYGIDNPLFLDYKKDAAYLTKKILPWLLKFLFTIKKIEKLDTPVYDYLKKYTDNEGLIDILSQHFFYNTPAYFALSYFSLYLDYYYPLGGTGTFPQTLGRHILASGGVIKTNCTIVKIDEKKNAVWAENGHKICYKKLVWAADSKALYQLIDEKNGDTLKKKKRIAEKKSLVLSKKAGESVLTLYLMLSIDVKTIREKITEHLFYTPNTLGLSNQAHLKLKDMLGSEGCYTQDQGVILDWVKAFLKFTTYEISCPVMRDQTLAPKGKIGLIISTLFEYSIVKHIKKIGFYDTFKDVVKTEITDLFFKGILKKFSDKFLDAFVSTPLSVKAFTKNNNGAITGWSSGNNPLPAISKLSKVASSIKTPMANIYQCGHWSFSPGGLPIAILTAKLAADAVHKKLK